MKLFFPRVIRFGEFQLGDDLNHPSTIVVDIFSILLICWVVKFLLDWPWKWYLQISDLEMKLQVYQESVDKDLMGATKLNKGDAISGIPKHQDITQKGVDKLHRQHIQALGLCLLAPLLCGVILVVARRHIILIASVDGGANAGQGPIFSDLNIGIFVSCGLVRVVIQLSEQVQRSTASIEATTEKIIQIHVQESLDSELPESVVTYDKIKDHQSGLIEVQSQLQLLQNDFNNLRGKFEPFYNKNRLTIENDIELLSIRHFKMLEKEVNELNHKLETKNIEVEHLAMQFARASTSAQSTASSSADEEKKPNSLHGVPLGTRTSTYMIDPQSGTPVKYPVGLPAKPQTIKAISSIEKVKLLFPELIAYSTAAHSQQLDKFDEEALKQLETLHDGGYLKVDLTVILPLLRFLISLPFLAQRAFWKVVSYVPSQVLKVVYYMLLQGLDTLAEMYHKNQSDISDLNRVAQINDVPVLENDRHVERQPGRRTVA